MSDPDPILSLAEIDEIRAALPDERAEECVAEVETYLRALEKIAAKLDRIRLTPGVTDPAFAADLEGIAAEHRKLAIANRPTLARLQPLAPLLWRRIMGALEIEQFAYARLTAPRAEEA